VTQPSEPTTQPIDPHDRAPTFLLDAHRWLDGRVSPKHRHRLGQVIGFGAAIIGTLLAIAEVRSIGIGVGLGAWIGLFLANWIGNGGLLVPIPGLRLVGWTMVVTQAATNEPAILVGLVGGAAMAMGQASFYLASASGSSHLAASQRTPRSGPLARLMRRAQALTAEFVKQHGFPTVLVLSLLPNPLTTFASITAGKIGMGFRHFLLADTIGHVSLGLILALFGQALFGS
jgi:membrane protein DedA with SNARE-associated domain